MDQLGGLDVLRGVSAVDWVVTGLVVALGWGRGVVEVVGVTLLHMFFNVIIGLYNSGLLVNQFVSAQSFNLSFGF